MKVTLAAEFRRYRSPISGETDEKQSEARDHAAQCRLSVSNFRGFRNTMRCGLRLAAFTSWSVLGRVTTSQTAILIPVPQARKTPRNFAATLMLLDGRPGPTSFNWDKENQPLSFSISNLPNRFCVSIDWQMFTAPTRGMHKVRFESQVRSSVFSAVTVWR